MHQVAVTAARLATDELIQSPVRRPAPSPGCLTLLELLDVETAQLAVGGREGIVHGALDPGPRVGAEAHVLARIEGTGAFSRPIAPCCRTSS